MTSKTHQPTVVIDGYNLDLEKGTGVATYARNLSYAAHDAGYRVDVLYGRAGASAKHPLMREIGFFDTVPELGWQKSILYAKFAARTIYSPLATYRAHPIPMTGQVVARPFEARLPYFDQIWSLKHLFSLGDAHFRTFGSEALVRIGFSPEIAHWTYPLPLRIPGARNIYTFHDLIPLRLPYTTLDVKRRYFKLVHRLAHRADHIVTVSENSRKDIINLLGAAPERVTNTYQAAAIPESLLSKPRDVIAREVEGPFRVKLGQYFLFYGAIEPKKNIGRLIDAFLAADVAAPLLIVGSIAWKAEEELRFLESKGWRQKSRIRHFDYAPFPTLVSLIRGAKAVLFPSLYEGFGLPVLESMSLGTPVMASNQSSIPEVAGEAALLVDPYDRRQMAEAIRRLDSDAELRAELAGRGPQQAARFSQEIYAKRIHDLYDAVLKTSGKRRALPRPAPAPAE
jgi:glycosyltransferase involved in cell wall biosynthesis